MAFQIKDRVQETTTTTGTGTLNLDGAVGSFQTFVAGVGDGNTTYYAITDGNGSAWEVGIGTVTDASPDTLARTTVLGSSTGSKISLSSASHNVFVTYPADKAIFKDASGFVGIGTASPSYKLDVFGHDAWIQASGVRIGASGIHLSGTKITATATELNYVDGVTSAVQTQLDAKQASLTFGISNTNAVKVDSASAADDEYARFTANGLESRSTSEVLSDIGAQASIGGAASTVTSSDLTASRALVSNGSGKIAVSSTTSTELGYLDISTLGTAEASKALTLDSGKKFTGIKDGTFNQYDSWVYASGVKIGASGISMDGSVIKTVQTSAESFVDNNSSLMTSAAIADKIEAYSYITATLTEEQVDDFVGGMIAGNTETGISVTYEDGDGTLDFVVSDTTVSGDSGSTGMTPGDTLTIAGGTNIATAMSGDTLTITGTDTNTTYTGGTNLTLSSTTFNVDDAFLVNNADDTTTGIITAKGLVANQYGSFVKASGIIIGASGISMGAGRPVVKTIQNSSMSFTDDNTSIMTSAAVADKIEDYSYITATLTQEQVEDYVGGMVAGNTETGITVAYQDADGTIDFAVADTTVAGDSGSTGMTPGDTLTIAGGTNATSAMSGDTLTVNVDDAFLVNNADDTTTGIITAKGLVANHYDSWVHASGTHVGASGIRFSDGTVQKTAPTDTNTTYTGGTNLTLSGTTFNVDDAFLKNDGSDTTTGTITAAGFTTTGTWTFDTSAGGTTGITNINVGSAFTDDDVTLMSAGAIKEKIEAYSYITTDTNTTYTGGTNLTLDGTTFNVDDAFLKNNADDTTTGIITAKGLVANHFDSLVHASGVHVGPSGVRVKGDIIVQDVSGNTEIAMDSTGTLVLGYNGDQSIRVDNATGTNIVGKSIDMRGGKSTGTGVGGKIKMYTGTTGGGSGSGANAHAIALTLDENQTAQVEAGVYIKEASNANGDTAAYGQLWVKTATPNQLYFTTDAGDDIQITSGTAMAGAGVDGSGAAGYLAYWSDADTLTYDNTQLFWDASSNELGIGTATPGSTLDISGSVGYKPFMISSSVGEGDTDWATIGANTYEIGSAVTYLVETGNTARTIELPDPSSSIAGRTYTIKKIDSGTGTVTIQPYASGSPPAGGYLDGDNATIDDGTNILFVQYDTISATCAEGTTSDRYEWHIVQEKVHPHCAKLEQQTAQNVPKSTITDLEMTHTIFSVGCSVADPTNDYIMITRKGKYLVGGYCRIAEMFYDVRYMYLEIHHYDSSTTTDIRIAGVTNRPSANDEPGTTTTAIVDLDVDDHITLRLLHDDASATVPTLSGDGEWERAFLWVQEIK